MPSEHEFESDPGPSWYDDEFWEDDDFEYELSCDNCGPWCEHWGGDGLCMLAIVAQAAESDHYHDNFVTEDAVCPGCNKKLTMYEIPTDKLWVWPGDFYNPMIALEIFAVYDASKGEVHPREGKTHHIWVGQGPGARECLIKLSGQDGLDKYLDQAFQKELDEEIQEAVDEEIDRPRETPELQGEDDGIPF